MKARKGRPKLDEDPAVNVALWRIAEILFEMSSSSNPSREDFPTEYSLKEDNNERLVRNDIRDGDR